MNEYLLDVNAHIQEARSKKQEARSKKQEARSKKRTRLFWLSEQSIRDGDTDSPFRPYGESLFVKRDKK
ncbi:hypothetical protein [Pseudomonas putida]|uniref:hypothetical protein n=1 Tax=Pseudomonas putida TaxID=303 RepID=UPI0015E07281|nr:hypothetical protein [Pseudomonas putida]